MSRIPSRPRLAAVALGLTLMAGAVAAPPPAPPDRRPAATPEAARRKAFQEGRFGLFVHWGVYALAGKGERVMEDDKLPVAEYEKLPPRFNPIGFDAEAWVKAAKAAGASTLTVSAKDLDGFCMFDSKLTRYDVVDATPFARDPIKAIAESCRKHGVALVLAYSLADWHHPDYFPLGRTGRSAGREAKGDWAKYVAYYQGQVRELCTNYGPIGGIRFDGAWDKPDADFGLDATYQIIHDLRPDALLIHHHPGPPRPGEDVRVFEDGRPGESRSADSRSDPSVLWESWQTLNGSRGHDARDRRFKSPPELVRLLVESAGRNANLLLSVGARADGTLPPEAVERLAAVGKWLGPRRASVFGTRGGPIPPQPWGVATEAAGDDRKGKIYLHVLNPDEPVRLPEAVLSYEAHLLDGMKPLTPRQVGKDVVLDVPAAARDPIDTVIVLTPEVLDPEPRRVKEID